MGKAEQIRLGFEDEKPKEKIVEDSLTRAKRIEAEARQASMKADLKKIKKANAYEVRTTSNVLTHDEWKGSQPWRDK